MRSVLLIVWVVLGLWLFCGGCTFHLGASDLGVDWSFDHMERVRRVVEAPVGD